jgi:hypothetical protein
MRRGPGCKWLVRPASLRDYLDRISNRVAS